MSFQDSFSVVCIPRLFVFMTNLLFLWLKISNAYEVQNVHMTTKYYCGSQVSSVLNRVNSTKCRKIINVQGRCAGFQRRGCYFGMNTQTYMKQFTRFKLFIYVIYTNMLKRYPRVSRFIKNQNRMMEYKNKFWCIYNN